MRTFRARGHYLIVKLEQLPAETKSEGGILLNTSSDSKRREQKGSSISKVIDIGANAWSGFVDPYGEFSPWCKVGDNVMIAQYAGQPFPIPDNATKEEKQELDLYRIIKDDDILAVEDL